MHFHWLFCLYEAKRRERRAPPTHKLLERSSPERNVTAVVPSFGFDKAPKVRKKILVVEDDLDLVELLRFNLANAGFSVVVAADGAEALKKARSVLPDLILLDLMLPELDGFAVCEILRRDSATTAIPIIILTAMSSQLARVAGIAAGANDYMTKPFSPKDLLKRVEGFLTSVASPEPTSKTCA